MQADEPKNDRGQASCSHCRAASEMRRPDVAGPPERSADYLAGLNCPHDRPDQRVAQRRAPVPGERPSAGIYASASTAVWVAARRMEPANPATAMTTPTDLGTYWAQPVAASREQP